MGTSGAWYAQSGSKTRELFTITHLPYTSMVLSYVLLGTALSPTIHTDRVILALIAYFLGLGLSAHALNELHARHWGEALSRRELQLLFVVPLLGALSIGGYGMSTLYGTTSTLGASLVLLALIVLETFFLFAYNTELFGVVFHSDAAFAFSWAALPTIIGYYVNSLTITIGPVLMAIAMAATGAIEINLSRWCKDFRRRSKLTEIQFADETKISLSTAELIAGPEKALKLIVLVVDLTAIGLIMYRLFP